MDHSWFRRQNESIAQGALTNSKRPECLVQGVYPTNLTKGLGCHVWDTSGRRYVDFICGLGASILGYGNTEVCQAAYAASQNGPSLSLPTTYEVLLAEKIKEIFPFVERLKFLKTGSEACTAAVRIARAKTGRKVILSEGYHGWHDLFVSMTPPALGVVDDFFVVKLGSEYEPPLSEVAAIIVEPIITDASEARIEWLRALRKRCTDHGTLLIFDEVITGFRYPKFSVANLHGIEPDLICLGKAMGNGFPISVVGGREPLMNCREYFVSSTFAGEMGSIAAALKTITLLQTKFNLDHLWEQGNRFKNRFNALWPDKIRIDGYGTRGAFVADPMIKALFWQEACDSGIIFGPSWFFNFSHIQEADTVLSTCADIVTRLKTGSVTLRGKLPASPFAQKMREKS